MRIDSVRKMNEVLGKDFDTKGFGKCFVIDYKNSKEVTVAFYKPFCVVKCQMGRLERGQVKNPLVPTFYNVGYIGVGNFGRSNRKAFDLWCGMLKRAYSICYQKRQPTYKDVTVCEEWHNFQNFAEWYYSQEFSEAKDEGGNKYQLDKDLLVRGNKIYSPKTCCFLPPKINSLIKPKSLSNGCHPLGVSLHKATGKFVAKVKTHKTYKHLGLFSTVDEAFLAYKKEKEIFIKQVAEKLRGAVSDKAYRALLGWEILVDV